jgi:four helix bundle protein
MKFTRFEDIECWQEARKLTRLVYEITNAGAFRRDLRLCSQIQAAAVSSMSNIAEGFIRRSDREFVQFLFIAMSSAAEVQSHLYVALDQGYISKEHFDRVYVQAEKTAKMISGLIKFLRTSSTKQTKQTKQTKRPNRLNRLNDQTTNQTE